MKNIITYNGKPIYASEELIDWWLVIKSLVVNLQKEGIMITSLIDEDFNEYRSKNTIRQESVLGWIAAYDLILWKWNEIEKDWYNS